jgi:pimeloyl-ACP methyl ester carboxylesterase
MVGVVRRWLTRLLLGYVLASLAAGVVLGELTVHPWSRPAPADAAVQAARVASAHQASVEHVRQTSADGLTLHAWLFTRPELGPHATVIVTHGHGSSRSHNLAYAEFLLDAGFDVLVPDARGHGESGGMATYGVREADDLRRWAAFAREKALGGCVYGLGASMGAAQLLLAEAGHPTFCAIVADASFATFLDAGMDRIAPRLGMGDAGRWIGRPAAYAGLAYVRVRYGVNLLQADPEAVIGRIRAPLLLIHGDADLNSPVYHTQALARAQPRADVWIIRGATHGGCWRAEPERYPRRIVAFFRQHGQAGKIGA